MSSKYSAARPKREGETFARIHHGEGLDEDGPTAKKVRFDVRNPSALVPDAREEEDDVLDADVIGVGSGTATKRGAVNIDGYDSDSDNDTFKTRANARGKGQVKYDEQMDSYDSKGRPSNGGKSAAPDDDTVDMFAAEDGDDGSDAEDAEARDKSRTDEKKVRFLDDREIEGQEKSSRSGGHVSLNDHESSEDEEEVDLAIQEEGVDEEVGAGGLKRHAPKIDAFNMRQEQEDGAFDEAGNYVRKAADPDAVHDKWLDGISKKDMKKAAAAQEKRDAELRQQRREDDSLLTSDLLGTLLQYLDKGETALEALARLGKAQTKEKKVPKWRQKKQTKRGDTNAIEVDVEKSASQQEQDQVKRAIDGITEAADKLLGRDYPDIYDTEREMLLREYRNQTGEDWVEVATAHVPEGLWEYRWTDGRDGADKQGPFDRATMKAWLDAGYFGEGVEFRPAGRDGGWTRAATFV